MITLDIQDRQQLISMLQSQAVLQNERSRREMLEFAGLQKVLPQIDLSGAPFVAVSTIISFLASYGRMNYDNEALGLFLNAIKFQAGIEQQEFIDQVLLKYRMMEPIVVGTSITSWKSSDTTQTVLEKIFGENTLRSIAFFARGLEVARSVAYVRVQGEKKSWSGTGFMITPWLLITNHHVVSNESQLPGVVVRFNYQQDFDGRDMEPQNYVAKPDGLYHANKNLDYAVFEVEGEPGNDWGYLSLKHSNIIKGQRINIIQHPSGQPKQISVHNNLVEYVGGNVLQYVTSTMPGSSGSPVFNDQWQVVGLHHAGGVIAEPTTGQTYGRNEGVLISKILDDLPLDIQQQVGRAAIR